jgi:L-fucose mutarotase
MLKTISPLLTPDALHALASMGHGDDLAIVDANFPAAQVAHRSGARLVQIAGADAPAVLAALLPLFPLDTFVPQAAWTMQVVGDPRTVPPPVADFRKLLHGAGEREPATLERFAFYEQAQRAFLILRSGEQRKYGNLILRKGVVSTD